MRRGTVAVLLPAQPSVATLRAYGRTSLMLHDGSLHPESPPACRFIAKVLAVSTYKINNLGFIVHTVMHDQTMLAFQFLEAISLVHRWPDI